MCCSTIRREQEHSQPLPRLQQNGAMVWIWGAQRELQRSRLRPWHGATPAVQAASEAALPPEFPAIATFAMPAYAAVPAQAEAEAKASDDQQGHEAKGDEGSNHCRGPARVAPFRSGKGSSGVMASGCLRQLGENARSMLEGVMVLADEAIREIGVQSGLHGGKARRPRRSDSLGPVPA